MGVWGTCAHVYEFWYTFYYLHQSLSMVGGVGVLSVVVLNSLSEETFG